MKYLNSIFCFMGLHRYELKTTKRMNIACGTVRVNIYKCDCGAEYKEEINWMIGGVMMDEFFHEENL